MFLLNHRKIDSSTSSRSKGTWFWLLLGALAGYFLVPVLNGVSDKFVNPIYSSNSLVQSVSIGNVYDYLVTFSDIARPRKNSRSVVNGFNASAKFIYNTLKSYTDYDVVLQPFEIDLFTEDTLPTLVINAREFVAKQDFATIQNSGTGSVLNGSIVLVYPGCSAEEFHSLKGGEILLLNKNGPCDYKDMLAVAANSSASSILLYTSNPTAGPTTGSSRIPLSIPVLGLSHIAAIQVLEAMSAAHLKYAPVTASLTTSPKLVKMTTLNVIATTPQGDDSHVIVAGSHLDSVPEGPGVNDDGSGAAATLEVALQFYRSGLSKKTKQKVRFGWWAGEEVGLMGSKHYVEDLVKHNQTALRNIVLNLNNDMLASPNYIRGVYNGYEAQNQSLRIPSGIIQDLFTRWFDYRGLPSDLTDFNGRSDYGPFLEQGIPAGGLFTGAEELKTNQQADKFGGYMGVPYDPCYHHACDTLRNVRGPGMEVLKDNLEAMGYIIHRLAYEEDIDGLLRGERALGHPADFD